MSRFAIYEWGVGNGVLAISPLPGRSGHYAADWAVLAAWVPDLVISMTPHAEMAQHGAGTLPDDLARDGIGWIHIPVVDFGVPESLDWAPLQAQVAGVLADHGRVLVHCLGGCGRSGMIALRLMIAAGEAPDDGLARLRGVRPCAVETDAQLAWALRG